MLAPVAASPHVVSSWQEAVAMVRNRSTDLRIAVDEILRAEALTREALGGALPTLNGSANLTFNMIRGDTLTFDTATLSASTVKVPDFDTYGASVTLDQPLFAPRAWHAIGTDKQNEIVARLSAEDRARLVIGAVADAIVGVVTAERVGEINRIGLRAALERLELARRRQALGAANALDVVRAGQDVEVARASVVSGDESLRKSRDALGLALGYPEPWGVPPSINLDALEQSAKSACPSAATVDERADIASAHASVEVAERNVDDATLRFSPTLDLISTFSATSVAQINTHHVGWTIAGVLTVPIWDGGVRYGFLRDARAQADEAYQRLDASKRSALVQVTQAKRDVTVAQDSLVVAQRARDLARDQERLSRSAFQAGVGTSLDLIESGRVLRDAEAQLALKEFDLVHARIAALLALAKCSIE